MNCPQCNTSLPDLATFCYKCGASTRQTAFSYLPAGAPDWPTTVPASPFYSSDAPGAVVQKGLPSAPAAKGSAKPPRSARGILILAALCVLAPVVGILATLGWLGLTGAFSPGPAAKSVNITAAKPQATPGTTSSPAPAATAQGNQLPTPTSFQTDNSREVGITLKYPSNWVADAAQTTTSGNVSVSFHPQQSLPVALMVGRLSATNSTSVPSTDVVNQANLQGFGTNYSLTSMQMLTNTPKHSSIGGTSWDEQDATFKTSSGDTVHAVSISVKHNNIYYNIFYFALASVYNEAVQKYYSQMLSSFQFLA